MKVYLAARYSRHQEMQLTRDQLREEGIEVTSRWIDGGHEWHGEGAAPHHIGYQFATEDLEDLKAADVVVCFTEEARSNNSRGGRHVEFGYALGLGKTIVICGPRENVFYCLRSGTVAQYEDWETRVEGEGEEEHIVHGAFWQLLRLADWHRHFAHILGGPE